jgi:hypothetical protein
VLVGFELNASAIGEPTGDRMEELTEIALELGDPLMSLRAIQVREYAGLHVPPLDRLAAAEQAYAYTAKQADSLEQITAAQFLLRASIIAGEISRVQDLLWEHRRLADRSGRRYARWFARTTEVGLLDAMGDAEAEDKARQALELGTEFGIPDALGTYAVHLLFSHWLAGTLNSVTDLMERAVTMYPKIAAWRAAAAAAHAQGGSKDEANRLLSEFIEMREKSAAKLFNLAGICLAATVAASLHNADSAKALLDALPRDSVEVVVAGMGPAAIVGPLPLFVALLERTSGDIDNARRHEVAARELCMKLGWSPWIAACLHVEENLLATGGATVEAQDPVPLGLKP